MTKNGAKIKPLRVVLSIVTKTKTFTGLTNRKASHVSSNVEKNLKTVASATNYVKFSPNFVLFTS